MSYEDKIQRLIRLLEKDTRDVAGDAKKARASLIRGGFLNSGGKLATQYGGGRGAAIRRHPKKNAA